MLTQLYIENVAVIEEALVDFSEGLNVFTGETGAGKSILIDSLSAVLGYRTSKDLVRTGAKKAFVRGSFQTTNPAVSAFLNDNHLPVEEVLICSREISADGKNVCRINGVQVNVTTLKTLGALLADIHGQQETQKLADPALHMSFVDAYGNLAEDLEGYKKPFTQMIRLLRMIRDLSLSEQEKEAKVAALAQEIDLLEKADLRVEEKDALQRKRTLFYQQEQMADALQRVLAPLEGEEDRGGMPEMLQSAAAAAAKLAEMYPDCKDLPDYLAEQTELLLSWRRKLRTRLDDISLSPKEIEEIETRLDLYDKMERKYGSLNDAIERLDKAVEEAESIRLSEDAIREKKAEYQEIAPVVRQKADVLTVKRQKAAAELCAEIEEELTFLNMPNITLKMAHTTDKLNANGADRMELLLSANKGEDPKPLAKIASGGELARVMLAFKSVLGKHEPEMCQVFDEIDSGISGHAAKKVGIRMARIGSERQVICVTHLAQIAAFADNHLLIQKESTADHTYTRVHPLTGDARKKELARIISGSDPTASAIATAEEMLQEGKALRG